MASERPNADNPQEMGFIAHLVELRDRVLRIVFATLAMFVVLAPFANKLYTALAGPLLRHLPAGSSMIAIDVTTPFLTPFKLAFVLAFVLAIPFSLYQVWAFIAPGLYLKERRLVAPLLASSVALFYVGMAFAYFIVMPVVFGFLTSTAPEGVSVMTDINRYLDFVLVLFLAFGIAFEVPVATYLVVLAGVTTVDDLANARRYVIVGAFLIGAIFTPPDVFSQIMLAVPMWALFELGLVIARHTIPGQRTAAGASEAGVPVVAAAGAASTAHAAEAHVDEVEPFRPLTEEELLAELDRAESAERALNNGAEPSPSDGSDPPGLPTPREVPPPAPATSDEPDAAAGAAPPSPAEDIPPSFDDPALRIIKPPRPIDEG